ncbi:MAG: DUF4197 domain-containing protein [Bacteroidetes bacterium]|nr:MAG: DUF4197 domain-containing protein [Bacteroidota bacterium]
MRTTTKLLSIVLASLATFNGFAQPWRNVLNKAQTADSALRSGNRGTQQGNGNIINGLKEALNKGVEKSVQNLGRADGFLGNAALKILLPPEAQQVERTLRNIGMGKMVDEAIVSMNRGAEDAVQKATPIFVNAVKNLTVQDGLQILRGADTAATGYLRTQTNTQLQQAFRPVINQSLESTGATKHWTDLVTAFNRVSLRKINPDLAGYVTEKATQGIFTEIAKEEQAIRKNPAARTTALLQQVFGN